MDASWGLQLQLQAWPVPNRRIQPQHEELDSLSMTNWILRTHLGRLTATAQIASEGEGSRAECVRGSSAAKNDLGQPTCMCVVGGSACFGRPRVEPPPPQ